MKRVWIIMASLVLAACGGVPQQLRAAPPPAPDVVGQALGVPSGETAHVKCRETGQDGCLGLRVPMYVKTGHGDFAPIDGTDLHKKVQDMPPALWTAYMRGEIPAAGPYTVQYSFYHINKNVGMGNWNAYKVNGLNAVTKAAYTVRTDLPALVYEQGSPLNGKPDLVVLVSSEGANAVATELQVPWDLIDVEKTYVVICIVDQAGNERMIYPSPSGKAGIRGGHTIGPKQFKWLRDRPTGGRSKRTHSPFVFTAKS